PAAARMASTPRTSPTAGLAGVLATLVTRMAPEAVSTATMSVKVPPVSMPMRKRPALLAEVIAARGPENFLARCLWRKCLDYVKTLPWLPRRSLDATRGRDGEAVAGSGTVVSRRRGDDRRAACRDPGGSDHLRRGR